MGEYEQKEIELNKLAALTSFKEVAWLVSCRKANNT